MNPEPVKMAPAPPTPAPGGFRRWLRGGDLATRRQRLLRGVLLGSLGLHVLAMLIFGGIRLVQYFTQEETVFGLPPSRTYEPARSSSVKVAQFYVRPSYRMALRPSQIALPEIVDPKPVTTTFQPSSARQRQGISLPVRATAPLTMRASRRSISTSRPAASASPCCGCPSDGREGARRASGFNCVRERLNQVVKALGRHTFSVIVPADACSVMSPKMVYASNDTRNQARQFLAGFNVAGNYGLDSGNYTPGPAGLRATGGTTRLDLAITAAMEQLADTILIISDGLPEVVKPPDPAALEAHRRQLEQWRTTHAAAIRAHEEAYANAPETRVWVPPQAARPPGKAPLKEGVRADPGAPARAGYWRTVRNVPAGPQPPAAPQAGRWSLADFIQHMTLLYEANYKPKSLKEPQVNCIGDQINREGGQFLNGLAKRYRGQYRLVRKLR